MSARLQARWAGPARLAAAMGILTLALAGCGQSAQQVMDETPPPGAAVTEAEEDARSLPDSAAAQSADATAPVAAKATPAPGAIPRAKEVQLAEQLKPDDVRALLAAHPEVLLLDVRQPEEWVPPLGHIDGAKLIPLPELNARLGELPEDHGRPIVTVCRTGRRSEIARQALVAAGFTNVANMQGGMTEWRRTE